MRVSPLLAALYAAVGLWSCGAVRERLSPDALDAAGTTALMRAAAAGDERRVAELLDRGADPNYQGRRVRTYSILFPFVEEHWEAVPTDSLTPLMVAAREGRAGAIRRLLSRGADPDRTTHVGEPGRTALVLAARAGQRDAALALVDGGARDEMSAWRALQGAIGAGHLEVARALARRGVGVAGGPGMDATGWHAPITEAARGGHDALLADLLAAGVDVRGHHAGTTLRAAAEHGHVGALRLLLEAGADPNAPGLPVHSTPLVLAASAGHVEAVRVLLQSGADPEAREQHSGATPLVLAAARGHRDVVRVLLDGRARVDATDARGMTALARAAGRGDEATMALLEQRGASPAARHNTALLAAAKDGRAAEVARRLAAGADVDVRDDHSSRTPLMLAALHGHREVVRLLLKGGADVEAADASGQRALTLAVVKGDAVVVGALIAAGARVHDPPAANPLPLAVAQGRDDLVRILVPVAGPGAKSAALVTAAERGTISMHKLLARGLDGAALGGALVAAARAGQGEAVRALLAAGAPPRAADARGVSALMWAAWGGDADAIRALVRAGADLDGRLGEYRLGDARLPNASGWTALMWAASEDRLAAVDALLQLGAEVDAVDSRNRRALDYAVAASALEVAEMLKAAGSAGAVDVGALRTAALLKAANRGHGDRVRELLGKGVSARAADAYGNTALHEAARRGSVEIVQALLDAGADVNARHRDGTTPLWLAAQHRHAAIADLLRARGAVEGAPGSGQ